MAEVALPVDPGRRVVIKSVAAGTVPARLRRRLEHTAGVLGISVREDGEWLHLLRPYVDGISLGQRLAAGPLTLRDALTTARLLLEALARAHQHGVLHGDVKPDNVIVDGGTPITAVSLIDFGLSSLLDDGLGAAAVSTVRYMPPELSGLLRRGVDQRADLYSAGATLWECLAGRPLFDGATIKQVLRQHLSLAPPAPPHTPAALHDVLARLLAKDPDDRYQSAEAVLADLEAIERALERGGEPRIVAGAHDRRATLAAPTLVGRDAELASLDRELTRALVGDGHLVLLAAPSGGGKSRILDAFALRAAGKANILRSRGIEDVARRPLHVLDGVLADLRGARPGADVGLGARLGPWLDAARVALPALSDLVGASGTAAREGEQGGTARTLEALVVFLDALGTVESPTILLLDDCQWADELTVKVLARWRATPSAPGTRHVMVVAAYRSDEVGAEHPLPAMRDAVRLSPGPLGTNEIHRLVQSMAGPFPADALAAVVRLAEGSPFLAAAVVQGMVERGALVPGDAGWRLATADLDGLQASRRAGVLLARRLDGLPPAALRLLTFGALCGPDFDVDGTARLAGVATADVDAALDAALRRQVVWSDANRRRVTFMHDKVREALRARVEPDERRALHLRIAVALEENDPALVFELAHHFDAAGERARALPYAMAAAAQARARHALEVAARYYRIAVAGSAGADAATRCGIAEALGDMLRQSAAYGEALEHLTRARDLVPPAEVGTLARIEAKIAESAYFCGRAPEGLAAIDRALGLLGSPVPRTKAGFALAVAREAAVQLGGLRASASAGDLAAIEIFSRAADIQLFHEGPLAGAWTNLRWLNVAERHPPTPGLALAQAQDGVTAAFLGWSARAKASMARAMATATALGDNWAIARCEGLRAAVLYCAASYAEAAAVAERATDLLRRVGSPWVANQVATCHAGALYRLGEMARCVEALRRAYERGVEFDDVFARCYALLLWAEVAPGEVPGALVAAERERQAGGTACRNAIRYTAALCRLHAGEPAAAAQALDDLARGLPVGLTRLPPYHGLYTWLAAARRQQALALPAWATAQRRECLAAARKAAARARRDALPARPGALRESGMIAALEGRPERARARLDEAVTEARRQRAPLEQARALVARGELGSTFGWPGAAADLETGRAALARLDPPRPSATPPDATAARADRVDALLGACRRIATALSREVVFAELGDAALALLRAEAQVIVEVGDGGELRADRLFSHELARRALATRRPVSLDAGARAPTSDSTLVAELRSALCAPIFVDGQPAACLQVTHRLVGDLFGAEEERVAELLAILAGAALENTRRVAAVQRAEAEIARLGETVVRSQEEERRRVALALHDGSGQLVASLVHRIDALAVDEADPARRALLGQAQRLAEELDAELRGLSHGLRPAALDRLGLPDALRGLARTSATDAVAVAVHVEEGFPTGPRALDDEVAVTLFRIAQAALANALRHARARRVELRLARRHDRVIELEVGDDGVGVDPAALDAADGMGIRGMRQRASWLGGSLELDTGAGRGMRVTARIPLRREETR